MERALFDSNSSLDTTIEKRDCDFKTVQSAAAARRTQQRLMSKKFLILRFPFLIAAAVSLPPHLTSACSSSSSTQQYKIVNKSDEGGKLVMVVVGENVKLSCQTNFPWTTCRWKPPKNGVRELACEHSISSHTQNYSRTKSNQFEMGSPSSNVNRMDGSLTSKASGHSMTRAATQGVHIQNDASLICGSFPEVHFVRPHFDVNSTHSNGEEKIEEMMNTCSIIVYNVKDDHKGFWECEFDLALPKTEQPMTLKETVFVSPRSWRYT